MSNQIECLKFKYVGKGSLLGFADLFVPAFGLEIYGCSVFQKDGRKWISFPSRETGVDESGKKKYWPHLRFKSRESMDKFSIAALQAIEPKVQECHEVSQNTSLDIVFPQCEEQAYLPF